MLKLRRFLLAALLLFVGAWAFMVHPLDPLLLAEPTQLLVPRSRWRFSIVDDATGEPTPAMVCIRDLDDGTVRLVPHGRPVRSPEQLRGFFRGVPFDATGAEWSGPPRRTVDLPWLPGRSVPFWSEPYRQPVSGEFSVSLPPGRYRISAARGNESVPVHHDFVVRWFLPGDHTLRLHRWTDLARLGWHSGDVHVHHPTTDPTHREFLLRYAEAEDVRVVNTLEMGHHAGTDFVQHGFGQAFRVCRGSHCLVSGQEDPRSTLGHVIGLNLSALVRDLKTYDFYDLVFAGIQEQPGALAGYAHLPERCCGFDHGFPLYAALSRIDFVEILQFMRLAQGDYYDYLDLGLRLTGVAGSDIPWGATLGEVRTYVYTGETLDLDAWFAGIEKGRTFVSNGPAIELRVDGERPGAELRRAAGARVHVRARAWGHRQVCSPVLLTLAGTGGTIADVAAVTLGDELTLDTEVIIERSRWLAASTICANGAVAQTSPVYVVVDGGSTGSPERGPALIAAQRQALSALEGTLDGQTDARSRGLRERIERARQFYRELEQQLRDATASDR